MQHQRKRIADGFISLEGGMDSGRNPSILERNRVSYASNVRFRGGFPACRPGIKKLNLLFKKPDTDHPQINQNDPLYEITDSSLQSAFQDSLMQGGSFYRNLNLPGLAFAMVGGRFFLIDLKETASATFNASPQSGYRVSEIVLTSMESTTVNSPGFTVPAIGSNVTIAVGSVANITTAYDSGIYIGGAKYTIITITAPQSLVIRNDNVTAGTVVVAGTAVNYTVRDTNSPVAPKGYFCNAEQFLVVQDGQSKPLIFDGTTLRRAMEMDSNNYPEIPTGTVMAYGNGRLWIAINGRYFVAGDIVGGPTGTDRYDFNDAIFKMTENSYLNEGGFFRVPDQSGDITAMKFAAVPDTSLGQGALQVYTPTHVISVNAPVDRDIWKNLQYPIQTISLVSNGAQSERSTILVNGDTFFRAKDGIRSFIIARREVGSWGQTPLSNEVSTVLNRDSQALLKFSSAVLFDNRLIMTSEPVPIPNGAYHRSLVALDFHPISAMSTRTPPAYDGIWDGRGVNIDFLQLFTGEYNGEERCFFFARNSSGKNEFWEMTKADRFDYAGDQTPVRIASFAETPSYPFQFPLGAYPSDSWQLKRLETGELFVDDIVGSVDFVVKYKPDQAPDWYAWKSWTETVAYRDCDSQYITPTCRAISCYNPNYRARMRLPEPDNVCETGQEKLSRYGYEFQARIEWTGSARIKKFRMQAIEQQEEAFGDCSS